MTGHGGTMLFGSGIVFMIVFHIDLSMFHMFFPHSSWARNAVLQLRGSGGYSTAVTQIVEVENELNLQVTFSCPPPGAGWEVQMLEAFIGNVAGEGDTKSGDPKSIQMAPLTIGVVPMIL